MDVCKIREGWAEARANGCFPAFAGSPAKIVLVNVFETTEVDLCLFQEGVRLEVSIACITYNLVIRFDRNKLHISTNQNNGFLFMLSFFAQ